MRYRDGSIYKGDWLNDKKDGQGKFLLANGDCYEGSYRDGVACGNGKY